MYAPTSQRYVILYINGIMCDKAEYVFLYFFNLRMFERFTQLNGQSPCCKSVEF